MEIYPVRYSLSTQSPVLSVFAPRQLNIRRVWPESRATFLPQNCAVSRAYQISMSAVPLGQGWLASSNLGHKEMRQKSLPEKGAPDIAGVWYCMLVWRQRRTFAWVFLRDAFWDQKGCVCDLVAGKAQAGSGVLDAQSYNKVCESGPWVSECSKDQLCPKGDGAGSNTMTGRAGTSPARAYPIAPQQGSRMGQWW